MQDFNEKKLPEYLTGVEYPAKKDALVDKARANGADPSTMSFLERIPDRNYESSAQVTQELGNLDHEAASEDEDMDNKAAF
jgi:hypothetical protein